MTGYTPGGTDQPKRQGIIGICVQPEHHLRERAIRWIEVLSFPAREQAGVADRESWGLYDL